MLYDLTIAWRNIRSRPVQTIVPALVIGLAIALALTVALLSDGTKEGIIKASDPFGVLVVGAKGSSQQLVVSTVLLQDNPVGNISYSIYEDLAADERVQLAVPLAFGDNAQGKRVIGTNYDFFELRSTRTSPPAFQLAEGRLFTEILEEHADAESANAEDEHENHVHSYEDSVAFEAILGSEVAESLGLNIGDTFHASHVEEHADEESASAKDEHEHEQEYTVVAILEPSGTVYDRAIFTQVESLWLSHADEEYHDEEATSDENSEDEQDHTEVEEIVSLIIVAPTNPTSLRQLESVFANNTDVQTFIPDLPTGDESAAIQQTLNDLAVMVVAPASIDTETLLNQGVLLQAPYAEHMPANVYDALVADPRANVTVPLVFGDAVEGFPLIGTSNALFDLISSDDSNPILQIADGALLTVNEAEDDHNHDHTEGLFEVVLGSKAAADTGYGIGDTFTVRHGLGPGIASDQHDDIFTVVGILQPSGTAYDDAIFTQLQSVWEVHAEHELMDANLVVAAGASGSPDEVTAILVAPATFAAQNQIAQEFYAGTEAQVAFPGQEIVNLFDLINQAQEILSVVAYLVLVIASFTVFLAMYNATVARERAIAIMRGLGSSQTNIFRIVIFEALIMTFLGVLIGRLIGYPTAMIIANNISAESAIPVPLRFLPRWEALLFLLPLATGILAGLLPAIMAYRVNVVEKLFPS